MIEIDVNGAKWRVGVLVGRKQVACVYDGEVRVTISRGLLGNIICSGESKYVGHPAVACGCGLFRNYFPDEDHDEYTPARRVELSGIIVELSHEILSASWTDDWEHVLWQWALKDRRAKHVHHGLNTQHRDQLRKLYKEAGGWFTWLDGCADLVFLSTNQWEQYHFHWLDSHQSLF